MFFYIILFSAIGILIGFLTGMIPGLHPNTVFAAILSISVIGFFVNEYVAISFITSLAVSNTFFDFIPSILFGAPEEDSVLSVLPGHSMLLEGNGYEAMFLATMGGLGVMFITCISLPFLLFTIPLIYSLIQPIIHIILMLVVVWMILTEKSRIGALSVFLISGIFGLVLLNSFPSNITLFPALSGLFGISTVIVSVLTDVKIPKQKINNNIKSDWFKGIITGWIAGMIAGLLPGIGSSQSGILASQFTRAKVKDFIVALGGINTSNIFFTFIVFYVLGKTRSGAVVAVSHIIYNFTFTHMLLVIVVAIMSSMIAGCMTIKISKIFIEKIMNINYRKTMIFVLLMLFSLVFTFSGFMGVFVSITGVFVGLFAISIGVRRTHIMGFLILPTIIYFSGISPEMVSFLW